MESLLVSGDQKFHIEDAFTHPWRVYWYQESRSFIWKMRLLIHGEFAGIRSPGVSIMENAFTHPWRVYWYRGPEVHMDDQESRSFIWKMCLLIHGEFDGIRSPEVPQQRCAYSSMETLLVSGVQKFHMEDVFTHPWRVTFYFYLGLISFYPLWRCGHLFLVSLFTHTEGIQESLNYLRK